MRVVRAVGRCLPDDGSRVTYRLWRPVVDSDRTLALFRGLRSTSTKTDSRTAPRERHGSPRPRTPSLSVSRPLERSRARELCNRSLSRDTAPCGTALEITTRGRFPLCSRFSCLRDLPPLLSDDLSSLAAVRPHRVDARPHFRRTGKALRGGRLECDRHAAFPRLPPRLHTHRPVSPRVEVLPSNSEEEGNVNPGSPTPGHLLSPCSTHRRPHRCPRGRGIGFGTRSTRRMGRRSCTREPPREGLDS